MPAVVAAVLVVPVVVVGAVLVVRGTGGTGPSAAPAVTSAATAPPTTPRSTAPRPAPTGGAEPTLPTLPGPTAGPGSQVTYEVTGTATGVSLVLAGPSGEITTTPVGALPYTSSFTAGPGFLLATLSATGTGGDLSCRITVDGAVVAQDTAAGGVVALALCSAF
ncbi:hypothetical protein GCM10027047_18300 [Rhodococcus aerolatus]